MIVKERPLWRAACPKGVGMRFVLLLLLAACAAHSPEDRAKLTVARLEFSPSGTCSGVFIGPELLLTASHCLEMGQLSRINGLPTRARAIRHDGQDHAVVVVDYPNRHWTTVNPDFRQGQRVFMYGNPAGRTDILRRGYIAGRDADFIYLDMQIGGGDSGAAVFNDRGEVVGLVTGYGAQGSFHMGLVRPFAKDFP